MKTRIEWADYTWNPVTGCEWVSRGCDNCYAKKQAIRFAGMYGYPADDPFRVTLHYERLCEPQKLAAGKRIFACSMGDLFHPKVPDDFIRDVFNLMNSCQRHIFMILTKRVDRMQDFVRLNANLKSFKGNVWLGATIEDEIAYRNRISALKYLGTYCENLFVSVEPLIDPVRFTKDDLKYLKWIIVGGESGSRGRIMHPKWVRDIRSDCIESGVPFFFKGWGEWSPDARGVDEMHRSKQTVQIDQYGVAINQAEPIKGDPNCVWMFRHGKGNTGCELDGEIIQQVPDAAIPMI